MCDLVKSPFDLTFKKFAEDIVTDCFICSPYITFNPVKMLLNEIKKKTAQNNIKVNILTDISLRALVQGATEVSALIHLLENHNNVCITHLPKIHAKVYIANQSSAIIASANFTHGGGNVNFEYGVKISDSVIVQKIQSDMNEYKKSGVAITKDELEVIRSKVEETKEQIHQEQGNISEILSRQQQEVEDTLVRAAANINNRTPHAIFSDALLKLLSEKPAKTSELHVRISSMYPDLCDDSIHRIIDGEDYGPLWKHSVRSAQNYLKRKGKIYRDKNTRLWHIVNPTTA